MKVCLGGAELARQFETDKKNIWNVFEMRCHVHNKVKDRGRYVSGSFSELLNPEAQYISHRYWVCCRSRRGWEVITQSSSSAHDDEPTLEESQYIEEKPLLHPKKSQNGGIVCSCNEEMRFLSPNIESGVGGTVTTKQGKFSRLHSFVLCI